MNWEENIFQHFHKILEENLHKINWHSLCILSLNSAIILCEQNIDKLNWLILSSNPSAIKLLEKHQEKIHWEYLSLNPNIFEYDYKYMSEKCLIYKEELMKNRFHPKYIPKFKDWCIDGFESDSE